MPFGFASDGQRRNLENLSRRKHRGRLDAHGRTKVGSPRSVKLADDPYNVLANRARKAAADQRAKASRRAEDHRTIFIGLVSIAIAALLIVLAWQWLQ